MKPIEFDWITIPAGHGWLGSTPAQDILALALVVAGHPSTEAQAG